MSLEMFSRLDDELGETEGKFDRNYRIMFPGLSVCYSDLQTAETQIRRQTSQGIEASQN